MEINKGLRLSSAERAIWKRQNSQLSRSNFSWKIAARTLGLLLCLAAHQSSGAVIGENRDQIKTIVSQAELMIKMERFDDARMQLLEADQLSPNSSDVRRGLRKLQDGVNIAVNRNLSDAHAAFDRKTPEGYEQARTNLEEALKIGGPPDILYFDLALTYERLGNLPKAAEYLKQCLDVMPDSKQKEEVQEKFAEITTGEGATHVAGPLYHRILGFNSLVSQPQPATAHGKQLRNENICRNMQELSTFLAQTPTVIFNLARCAEIEARTQDAMNLWEKYGALSPDALDSVEIREKLQLFHALDEATIDKREEIKQNYLRAEQAFRFGRLDVAAEEYHLAEQLDQALPETKLSLGLLYDSCGDIDQASKYLQQVLALPKSNPEQTNIAQEKLNSMYTRRAVYDSMVTQARAAVDDLLANYNNYSFLSRKRELDKILTLLQPAHDIFPNGWEINELLAPIYEETGNARLAMRSRDVMWLNHKPVYFYAKVRIGTKTGKEAAKKQTPINTRIEVMPDSFKIVNIADGPIAIAMIRHVEATPAGALAVQLEDNRLILMDIQGMGLLSGAGTPSASHWGSLLGLSHWMQFPNSGSDSIPLPVRRVQANKGVRMFQRYLGIEDAKLGPEKYTFGEKTTMVGWMAFNGLMMYSSIYGPASAWTQISNLYGAAGGIRNTINVGANFTRMIRYQHPVTESTQFRAISTIGHENRLKLNWK